MARQSGGDLVDRAGRLPRMSSFRLLAQRAATARAYRAAAAFVPRTARWRTPCTGHHLMNTRAYFEHVVRAVKGRVWCAASVLLTPPASLAHPDTDHDPAGPPQRVQRDLPDVVHAGRYVEVHRRRGHVAALTLTRWCRSRSTSSNTRGRGAPAGAAWTSARCSQSAATTSKPGQPARPGCVGRRAAGS